MNIGATAETGFGLYFGWGEKTGHALTAAAAGSIFDGTIISDAFEGTHSFSSPYPTIDGSTQDPTTLPASNDAATVNWGAGWRIPTGNEGEFKALNDNTTNAWTDNYNSTGVKGRTFTGKNETPDYSDITLFFPAAGVGNTTSLYSAGTSGNYWSSTLYSSTNAYRLSFSGITVSPQDSNIGRYYGFSVRPVSD